MISHQNRQLKFLYLVYMVYSAQYIKISNPKKDRHMDFYSTIFSYQTIPLTACITHLLTDSILTFTQHLHSINHYQIINHINSISLMQMKVPLLVHFYFSQMKKKNNYSHVKILCQKKKIQMRWLAILLTCCRPLGN